MRSIELTNAFNGKNADQKFNAYRALWKEAAEFRNLTSFPLHLDIELSGVCNLKCKSCFQNGMLSGPLGLMDVNLFKAIIDEGVSNGLCAIKLQVRGESMLHPQFFDCIVYAKKKGVLDIQVTTNGTLLNQGTITQLIDSGLDAVILSVDSHHAASVEGRKKEADYSLTEKNINALLEYRKKTESQSPWIRLQSSIPQVDKVSYNKARAYLENKFPLADIYVISRIFDFRCDYDAYPDLNTNYTLLPCPYPMQRLAIFWNGEVTFCCSDYNNRFRLGRVPDQSIKDIWLSKKLMAFRRQHINGMRPRMDICRHCQAALQLKKNRDLVLDETKCHMADHRK